MDTDVKTVKPNLTAKAVKLQNVTQGLDKLHDKSLAKLYPDGKRPTNLSQKQVQTQGQGVSKQNVQTRGPQNTEMLRQTQSPKTLPLIKQQGYMSRQEQMQGKCSTQFVPQQKK